MPVRFIIASENHITHFSQRLAGLATRYEPLTPIGERLWPVPSVQIILLSRLVLSKRTRNRERINGLRGRALSREGQELYGCRLIRNQTISGVAMFL